MLYLVQIVFPSSNNQQNLEVVDDSLCHYFSWSVLALSSKTQNIKFSTKTNMVRFVQGDLQGWGGVMVGCGPWFSDGVGWGQGGVGSMVQ